MQIINLSINEIKEYENNPRINNKAIEAVQESIASFGFKVPIVLDENKVIIAGHTRLAAAARLGLDTVPCIIADDLTPEKVKAYRLADNKTAELAEWDFEKLEQELSELNAFDIDMSAFGFDAAIFDDFKVIEEDTPPEVDDEREPITQRGDIWQIGRHRLICGDSTVEGDIKRLMDGTAADMLLTDPPYNVNYEGIAGKIQNDNMAEDAFEWFLIKAFAAADRVMREGAAFYIWHADSEGLTFRAACSSVEWKVRQCLIWVKNSLVMGRQDYQWKHEPCLYGWKDGAAHYFIDDRTQTTVFEDKLDLDKLKKDEMKTMLKDLLESKIQTTVLHEDKPLKNAEHPTMKPVNLFARLIKNSTTRDDIILDIFGGSGTTLIACEQLDRICYTSELDPKYCDVIINRWENLTGQKAVKIRENIYNHA